MPSIPVDEEIRAARRRLGLTQRELADLAGVSLKSVCRLEQRQFPRNRSRVLKLVRREVARLDAIRNPTQGEDDVVPAR